MLSVAVIISNYLHDLATGLLLSSAVILSVLARRAEREGPEAVRALAASFPTLTRFALGALAWIVVGGIPRLLFFTRYEWDPAVAKGIVPALAVKHLIMAAAVVVGGVLWVRVARRLRSETSRP